MITNKVAVNLLQIYRYFFMVCPAAHVSQNACLWFHSVITCVTIADDLNQCFIEKGMGK